MGWRALSLPLPDRLLPESSLLEEVQTRKILADILTATSLMGSLEAIQLIQVCGRYPQINLLINSREQLMGIIEHAMCIWKNKEVPKSRLWELSWNFLNQARNRFQISRDPPVYLPLTMNIICQNCRGALNPRFRSTLDSLISKYNPSLVIVTETRISGTWAKDITNRLPFDGDIHTNTIGYAGGLQLSRIQMLWKSLNW